MSSSWTPSTITSARSAAPGSDFAVSSYRRMNAGGTWGAALWIRPDQQVVLYAPTFRDHLAQDDFRAAMVDFLDTLQLSAELGPDWVILVRGHAFNARVDSRLGSHGAVLDVTDYPDFNDLSLASDVAVLDYSSLRFDSASACQTSRCGRRVRVAPCSTIRRRRPGRCCRATTDVAAALLQLDRVRVDYADAYTTFSATFCDLDDGHAAQRLVDRVFDH